MLAIGRWFSPGTPASSTTKTGRHDIAEILLKVVLSTKNQIKSNWVTTSDWHLQTVPTSPMSDGDRCGRDRMIVGFTTTCAISTYHHWSCEFEARPGETFPTGRWFSPNTSVSSTNKTDRHDITGILLKVALNIINQPNNNDSLCRKFKFQSYLNIINEACAVADNTQRD